MNAELEQLLPPAVLENVERTAAELPWAVLMRVNFIPGVRQRLGWRGLRQCSLTSGGLTAKVAGRSGVFGVAREYASDHESRGYAEFGLYYFPDPAEELLEAFSIAACQVALQDDFLDQVREFTAHPQLLDLFGIGRVLLEIEPRSGQINLGLAAAERQLLISADGVRMCGQSGAREVVAAGAADQDLPAWTIALEFFRVLAASFSFCLRTGPEQLSRWQRAGKKAVYSQSGEYAESLLSESHEWLLMLGWGKDNISVAAAGFTGMPELQWSQGQAPPVCYAAEPWWNAQVPGAGFSVDKNTMGINEKPKLLVLTGFLGAGKTSFLNHFIEYQASRNAFVAIIQNEIGAKGLDSRMLGQHYAVTDMDEGCVCCTLSGNLKLALGEILAGYQPDFVVIETTGLANPANFLSEVCELSDRLEFCSVTTVVDASRHLSPFRDYQVAKDQVALADVILINKFSRLAAPQLAELERYLRQLNPFAALHQADHGDFSPALLYGVNFSGQMNFPQELAHRSASGRTHLDDEIGSALVLFEQCPSKHQFLAATASFPAELLRAKGIVQFAEDTEPQVYQYVPGEQTLSPLPGVDSGERFVVLIGKNIDRVAACLNAWSVAGGPP